MLWEGRFYTSIFLSYIRDDHCERQLIMFVDLLAEVSILSKQNQKSESAEPTVRKRQNVTKDGTHSQTGSEYTKEQLDHVKR